MKLLILNLFFSVYALAATELTLKTPRGTEIPVIVHSTVYAQARAVLVVGPGQSCNFRNEIFETLGSEGEKAGVAVIRFEWSYCSGDRQVDRGPSEDYAKEIEDMQTVLTFAQGYTFGDYQRLILAGKSLGSVVAYKLFTMDTSLKALLLLTPVCSYTTDANDNPLPDPIPLGEINYPNLKNETRPIMMALGNRDPYCLTPLLYDFLKDTKIGRVSTVVGVGDHGLRSFNQDQELDKLQTSANINAIFPPIFNWISFQIKK